MARRTLVDFDAMPHGELVRQHLKLVAHKDKYRARWHNIRAFAKSYLVSAGLMEPEDVDGMFDEFNRQLNERLP